jgi:hypothetical protein
MDRMTKFNAGQAARFFSEWQDLHEDPFVEWSNFFSSWEQLAPVTKLPEKKPPFDCEGLESFANAFTEPFKEYRKSGAMLNVWRAAGLGSDELRNSQVLAWVLDKFGDHGQGSTFLEGLVALAGHQLAGVSPEIVSKNNYWTRLESLPFGDLASRMDIEIESPEFLIFIEVKVRAPETGNQLERYVDLAIKKAARKPWFVIFLTTDRRKPANNSLHNKIVSLSWKDIANLLDSHNTSAHCNSFTGRIFQQLADHFRHLAK